MSGVLLDEGLTLTIPRKYHWLPIWKLRPPPLSPLHKLDPETIKNS